MQIVPFAFYATLALAFTFSVLSLVRVVLLSKAKAAILLICGFTSVTLAWNRALATLAFTALMISSYVVLGVWRHRRNAFHRYHS